MKKRATSTQTKRALQRIHRYLEALFALDQVSFNILMRDEEFHTHVRKPLKRMSGCKSHERNGQRKLREYLEEETRGLEGSVKTERLKQLIKQYAETEHQVEKTPQLQT